MGCNGNTLTIEIVKERIKNVNEDMIVLSDKWVGSHVKLKLQCKIDGNIWFSKLGHIERKQGCKICRKNNKIIIEKPTDELREKLYHINPNIQIINDIYKSKR